MNLEEIKTYESAVSYCLAVPRFTKKNDMESTRAFFEYMKSPGTKAQIIHIAGTNGKGSVSAFLQSICLQSGKKVGMFTSSIINLSSPLRYLSGCLTILLGSFPSNQSVFFHS